MSFFLKISMDKQFYIISFIRQYLEDSSPGLGFLWVEKIFNICRFYRWQFGEVVTNNSNIFLKRVAAISCVLGIAKADKIKEPILISFLKKENYSAGHILKHYKLYKKNKNSMVDLHNERAVSAFF